MSLFLFLNDIVHLLNHIPNEVCIFYQLLEILVTVYSFVFEVALQLLIVPWDKNPRFNEGAIDAVAQSIDEFGMNVPIVLNPQKEIMAGHTRVLACKKLKEIFEDLKASDYDVTKTGFQESEVDSIMNGWHSDLDAVEKTLSNT